MENNILKHRQMVVDRIISQTINGFTNTGMLQKAFEEELSKGQQSQPLIVTEMLFHEALEKGIFSGFDDVFDDSLEKGMKDRSHLQKKIVTTKTGHKMTVYVKSAEGKSDEKSSFNPNGVMQKKELTKEDIEKVKGHEHKLSHINRKRFDREHEKHFGNDKAENPSKLDKKHEHYSASEIKSLKDGAESGKTIEFENSKGYKYSGKVSDVKELADDKVLLS